MTLRKPTLPPGWHPQDPDEIVRFLSAFSGVAGFGRGWKPGRAVVAPHAGWLYSGKIAAKAIARLDKKAETVAIAGGHLPNGRRPLFAMEDFAETPLGKMPMDRDLRAAMIAETSGWEDDLPDNTVESLLPMARFFFPDASLLWTRFPDDLASFEAGKTLAVVASRLGRSLVVVASADLTHYGRRYGFAPMGEGLEALRWVSEVNDRRLIAAVESGDPRAVLRSAREDKTTCAAGAIIAAMGFAQATGAGPARLIDYGTSADLEKVFRGGSFVSYAAFAF